MASWMVMREVWNKCEVRGSKCEVGEEQEGSNAEGAEEEEGFH